MSCSCRNGADDLQIDASTQIYATWFRISDLQFLLGGEVFRVRGLAASLACDRLAQGPRAERLEVHSAISAEIFRLFRSAVEGEVIEITNANVEGLSAVCDEFGFGSLLQRLRAFKDGPAHQQKLQVDALEERVRRLEADIQALPSSHQTAATAQAGLESDVKTLKGWAGPRLDSAIVPALPPMFAEFQWKRFSLLWRGGRDGFAARDFHSRCDGHANTLTVILDTNGNVFGGFTTVEWESRASLWWGNMYMFCNKPDASLKSFLFTLKNPHNVPARRFALKAEKKDEAIFCDSGRGPDFCDICVWDNCNTNTNSFTFNFGISYTNDTGLDGKTFFTGSETFKLKEIEVFEITD
jgi:hypothetical protein